MGLEISRDTTVKNLLLSGIGLSSFGFMGGNKKAMIAGVALTALSTALTFTGKKPNITHGIKHD